ncbi:hypothetical protein ABZ800_25640 [Streptomyces sp. NPDC047813]|uniref:hypothetical protein n=1 Tax=Streptomyces sp. NPDC047813 TaxID=3154608 RepID=UPI0033F12B06
MTRKKSSPTVAAVKSEASRLRTSNQDAAARKALLNEVPSDIRAQGRQESTQARAHEREHGK